MLLLSYSEINWLSKESNETHLNQWFSRWGLQDTPKGCEMITWVGNKGKKILKIFLKY